MLPRGIGLHIKFVFALVFTLHSETSLMVVSIFDSACLVFRTLDNWQLLIPPWFRDSQEVLN